MTNNQNNLQEIPTATQRKIESFPVKLLPLFLITLTAFIAYWLGSFMIPNADLDTITRIGAKKLNLEVFLFFFVGFWSTYVLPLRKIEAEGMIMNLLNTFKQHIKNLLVTIFLLAVLMAIFFFYYISNKGWDFTDYWVMQYIFFLIKSIFFVLFGFGIAHFFHYSDQNIKRILWKDVLFTILLIGIVSYGKSLTTFERLGSYDQYSPSGLLVLINAPDVMTLSFSGTAFINWFFYYVLVLGVIIFIRDKIFVGLVVFFHILITLFSIFVAGYPSY